SVEIMQQWGMEHIERYGALRLEHFRIYDYATCERLDIDLQKKYRDGVLFSLGHSENEQVFYTHAKKPSSITVNMGEQVTDLIAEGSQMTGVATQERTYHAKLVILAAGTSSPL